MRRKRRRESRRYTKAETLFGREALPLRRGGENMPLTINNNSALSFFFYLLEKNARARSRDSLLDDNISCCPC